MISRIGSDLYAEPGAMVSADFLDRDKTIRVHQFYRSAQAQRGCIEGDR